MSAVDEKKFGAALAAALRAANMNQVDLARTLGKQPTYVSAIMHGRKGVSGGTVDQIAGALNADEATTRRLHQAAAVDQGFRIDLPEDW